MNIAQWVMGLTTALVGVGAVVLLLPIVPLWAALLAVAPGVAVGIWATFWDLA